MQRTRPEFAVGPGADVQLLHGRPQEVAATAKGTGSVCGPARVGDAGGIGCDKGVAPPAGVEEIVALAGQLLEDVDAAVHQVHHGIAGPGPQLR